jgi:hypothetical protein
VWGGVVLNQNGERRMKLVVKLYFSLMFSLAAKRFLVCTDQMAFNHVTLIKNGGLEVIPHLLIIANTNRRLTRSNFLSVQDLRDLEIDN